MKKFELECNVVYYPQEIDEITKIITEIELEYLQKNKFYSYISDALAEQLFARISRSSLYPSKHTALETNRKDDFIRIRSKIHMDYKNNWTIEEMAKLVNLSPSRFFCIYKQIFEISPQKDLCQTRIQSILDRSCIRNTMEPKFHPNQMRLPQSLLVY